MPLRSQCLMMMIETFFGSCQRVEASCSLVLPRALPTGSCKRALNMLCCQKKTCKVVAHTVVSDPKLLKNLIGLVYRPIRNLIGFTSQTNKTSLV